jgi:putative membrane protein
MENEIWGMGFVKSGPQCNYTPTLSGYSYPDQMELAPSFKIIVREHDLTAIMIQYHNKYVVVLTAVFSIEWILLAISPHDRADWALENAIVAALVILLAATYKKFPLSRVSYTLIFIFLMLHEIGAHYTYAEVPYDEWMKQLLGYSFNQSMGFERNHFDRLVHFSYGLLLAYPIREVFIRIADVKGFWGYFLPLDLTMSTSMMYELLEWGAARLLGGDLGMAYLGTQGDIWDAHMDMALASLGALVAMMMTALINSRLQRDFAKEWNESLRIKGQLPLGEDQIKRYLDEAGNN